MPLIEVDDATAAAMRQHGVNYADRTAAQTAASKTLAAIQKLESGPRRTRYLELLKEEFPEMVIPEVDAAKPVNDAVTALGKRFDDWVAAQEKKEEERTEADRKSKAEGTVTQGRSWLRRERKLDDDGVTAVEKIMQEEGIPNYQAAFLLWRDRNPATESDLPTIQARSMDWFKAETEETQADMKLRLANPIGYRQKRIPQMLQQLRRGEIDEFGRPLKQVA